MCGRFTATFDSVTYGFAGTSTALHFHAVGKKQTPAFFSAACSSGLDEDAPVADGVLVDLSLGGTSVIGLAVQCPTENILGRSKRRVRYTTTFLTSYNATRGENSVKFMDAEIDLSDVIQ
jgi:hypothetical protein